jgi:uncharacterized protein involved in type VI secretion and phage assembly
MSPFEGFDLFETVRETKDKRMYGVTVGIVTNNQDPDKLGRVKVKLPIRKLSSEGDTETDWARVSVPMAGKQRGMFFLPEVDDEVLVAFLDGDINCPYIIGGLWNDKDTPPETNEDGKNNIRKIKSRSGHQITFNDEEGKEKIEIKTKSGDYILLEDTKKIEIKDKSGNNSITIDSSGNSVALKGQNSISIKSDTKVEIEAGGNKIVIDSSGIKIESSAQLNIKGNMVTVEGGGTAEIKSGGILTVKGSMVKIN